jgi:hypothetical protein
MAVTVTPVSQPSGFNPRATMAIFDIIATVDADTTATITHGLIGTPALITITPLLQASAAVSEWAATTINSTQVVLTKGTGVGSGNAGAQVRCVIQIPHTLTQ